MMYNVVNNFCLLVLSRGPQFLNDWLCSSFQRGVSLLSSASISMLTRFGLSLAALIFLLINFLRIFFVRIFRLGNEVH